jgi:heat shock 70kDa protein 4
MKSNFKNTCRNLKLLLGRTMEDPEIQNENFFALAPLDTAQDDGSVGFRVMYKGEEKIFSASRVMAALLTKLKQTSEWSTGQPVRDVVVSVGHSSYRTR